MKNVRGAAPAINGGKEVSGGRLDGVSDKSWRAVLRVNTGGVKPQPEFLPALCLFRVRVEDIGGSTAAADGGDKTRRDESDDGELARLKGQRLLSLRDWSDGARADNDRACRKQR
jgi:hypothetical protein